VGVETASALRDFLKTGVIRNAVNFPAVAPDEFQRLQPYMAVGEQLGALVGQMGEARIESVGVRYYGELAGQHPLIVNAVLVGLFKATLSEPVTAVNARATATARGIDIVESSSSRTRNFRSLLSVKLVTDAGERWVEATVADRNPRLVLLNGVPVEAPLSGTLLLISNNDQPGVIGDVGTILGRHGVNIANFALGRDAGGAVGVVNVDAQAGVVEGLLDQLRAVAAVRHAWLVQV
jgi:D-3-phosphoglycerate dehydrogenase